LDIVVKGILEYVQSLEGHKNSVLAGGAVRDQIYGLVPNDYDIFVPSKHPRDIEYLIQSVGKEFNISDVLCKTKSYDTHQTRGISKHEQRLTSVWELVFEGKKIDLIGQRENDDEDFPFEVIKSFDYGINMIYDNGSYVDSEDENFRYDRDYQCMSLINLHDMSALPKLINRYQKFSKRYRDLTGGEFRFRAPCLQFTDKKEKKLDHYLTDSYSYGSGSTGTISRSVSARLTTAWTEAATTEEPGWGAERALEIIQSIQTTRNQQAVDNPTIANSIFDDNF